MHPLDGRKVRRLARDLYDLAAGRRAMMREGLRDQLCQLMGVRADVDATLDDLLAQADDSAGAGPLELLISEAIEREAPAIVSWQ